MPIERVMGIIREGSGSHFDPQVAEALEGLVAEDAEFFHKLHRAA
jgi:HD-GYP domain-containing protein (c-di-GMP phosphodiesterase class II)